jgi:hypothetical protein
VEAAVRSVIPKMMVASVFMVFAYFYKSSLALAALTTSSGSVARTPYT